MPPLDLSAAMHAEEDTTDASDEPLTDTLEVAETPSRIDVRAGIERLASIAASVHGCEVVSVEWRRETQGYVARVYVERLGHDPRHAVGGVTLEQCSKVSRDLGQALEVEELIAHDYNLEVSSPGLERPLGRAADFHRFLGLRAKVTLRDPIAAHPGRRVFRGLLAGVGDDRVKLEDEDVGLLDVPFASIARAHLVYVPPKGEKGQRPKKASKKVENEPRATDSRDAKSTDTNSPTSTDGGHANHPSDASGTTARRAT